MGSDQGSDQGSNRGPLACFTERLPLSQKGLTQKVRGSTVTD